MRCRVCRESAVINLPRHNIAFCKACFCNFVHTQVTRGIKAQQMFTKDDRILVAVSGGKDSLTLWEILLSLGYRADAVYVDLGIGDYSIRSRQKVQNFADKVTQTHDATLHIHTVREEAGVGVKELANLVHRPTCSACGTIKRYQFNHVALEQNYDVMATGHNLDDEAARLLGNVLHWQTEYLEKQTPVLPASIDGFAKKVKPLYRLTEREIAAYAVINRIDYIIEECPMAKGSKMLMYKDALNRLETESPGTKQSFYWKFLEQQAKKGTTTIVDRDRAQLHPCPTCGQPTSAEVCSYCKLLAKAKMATSDC
ncbi:MAG: phosphoadenosine phosphosulfate reductase family protein [Nitrospirales bacterium]|nr:phosphoadenosine phosphosulfate reductase family protein [Nitrospirales bacterium]